MFNKDIRTKDGYCGQCRECVNTRQNERNRAEAAARRLEALTEPKMPHVLIVLHKAGRLLR